MHTSSTSRMPRLAALGAAAALACLGSSAHASLATLNIDAFIVSSTAGYVQVVDSFQNFSSSTATAGGLGGGDGASHTADDWNPTGNISASSPYAQATGLLQSFFDGNTGLTTAGFFLNSAAQRGGIYATPPFGFNTAEALGGLQGGFALLDYQTLDRIGGEITFSVYYSYTVQSATDVPFAEFAQVDLSVSASDDDENYASDSIGALSTDFASGSSGLVEGVLSWTFNLASGADYALVTLGGNAFASAWVPEPASLALVSLALGVAGVAGRKKAKAAA